MDILKKDYIIIAFYGFLGTSIFIETPGNFAPPLQLMGIYWLYNTIPEVGLTF